jgi:regulator of replication initiation timing
MNKNDLIMKIAKLAIENSELKEKLSKQNMKKLEMKKEIALQVLKTYEVVDTKAMAQAWSWVNGNK